MKRIFTMLALAAFILPLLAQSPDLMSYQAVLRNAENNLITNQPVAVQISILQGAPNGTPVFTEVHALNTNANGLISLVIGDGVGDDLSTVDWSAGPYFIKTETDPAGGSNYTITSTTQLLSVPYAKYADEAGNVFSGAYGDLSGAPTVISAFTNDEGYLTSHLWSQNGSNLYYDAGFVGIGTSNPVRHLTINSGAANNYLAFHNDGTGSAAGDGFLVGNENDLDGFVWNWENAPIHFGTSNSFRMVITGAGDVGIGTQSPTARLDVRGDTKIGTNGVAFNELREITGITHATNDWITFALPAGYNMGNTRVLSIEINYLGDRWMGMGFENGSTDQNISYALRDENMTIYYPDGVTYLNNRAFRVLIMQIAP